MHLIGTVPTVKAAGISIPAKIPIEVMVLRRNMQVGTTLYITQSVGSGILELALMVTSATAGTCVGLALRQARWGRTTGHLHTILLGLSPGKGSSGPNSSTASGLSTVSWG